MDVHFELINDQTNASQVLRPLLVTNESIVSLKRKDETAVKQATVITSSPVFGDVQTGKILTRIVIKNGQFAKLSFCTNPIRESSIYCIALNRIALRCVALYCIVLHCLRWYDVICITLYDHWRLPLKLILNLFNQEFLKCSV